VIPGNFPEASTANETVLKAGLTGAMVYNTNADLCTGVHVWNGDYWKRIVSGLPRESAGTPLSITSDVNTLFVGGTVDFEVTTVAKTCTWYVNTNGAGYKYLATTIEPRFSWPFFDGNHTVKVISDNCRFLEESNEVNFEAGKVSPSFGSVAGGNYVYVYGEFDYASSSDYEQDGLVAHYDGIDNTGEGDKSHSNELLYWTELKGNTQIPLVGDATGNGWQSKGYKFATDKDTYFYQNSIPSNFPTGNHDRTIEITFITPSSFVTKPTSISYYLADYGTVSNCNGDHSGIVYNFSSDQFYGLNGCGSGYDYMTELSNLPAALTQPNKINTATLVYTNKVNDPNTKGYVNGEYYANTSGHTSSLNTPTQGAVTFGTDSRKTLAKNAKGFTIVSYRLYDRTLTKIEIERNAARDQIRFIAPPTVKFGDNFSEEVIVLSPHFLMCKVPAGAEGSVNVKINDGLPYSNAYKYVAASEFHISGISPIIGPAKGATVTLTGNKLDEITGIEVDNAACPFILGNNNTECTVTLPAHEAGEVDIIIITTGNQKYRLAKVFEYQD
jgi:hypothetical protein